MTVWSGFWLCLCRPLRASILNGKDLSGKSDNIYCDFEMYDNLFKQECVQAMLLPSGTIHLHLGSATLPRSRWCSGWRSGWEASLPHLLFSSRTQGGGHASKREFGLC